MAQVQNVAKKENKPNLRYLRDKSREMVKGIFKFYEVPGGKMEFVYKEFKEDAVEKYEMYDGQMYTIPLGVARHLNKNGWYPEYAFMQGEKDTVGGYSPDGQVMRVGKKVRRFGFQSLEFLDLDEMPSAQQIVTVENVTPGL